MKKRKPAKRRKVDEFEKWLENWRSQVDDEICKFPPEDRVWSDPTYQGLAMEYKSVHLSLIKYRAFRAKQRNK